MNNQTSSKRLMTPGILWDQMRQLPAPVWVLCAGTFVNRFGTFVVPFLALYLKEKGYLEREIWMVFALMAIGGIGSTVAGGFLTDRIGRKNTMALALSGGGCAMLLLWQADSLWSFGLTAALVSLSHGMYHPAAHSLLADVVPPERRVTAFALVRWAINLGFAFGMAAGGFLAEHSYTWLFLGDAATSLVFAGVAFLALPHGIRTEKNTCGWGPALRHIRRNRRFLAFLVGHLFGVTLFFHWGGAITRLVTDLGYSKQMYGWIMAVNGMLIALMEIPISAWMQRYPTRWVIGVGFFICGVGLWLNVFAVSWVIVLISVIIFTLGEMVAMPVASAYLAELSPDEMRGRYAGVMGLNWSVGHALAPGLGLVVYAWSPAALWIGCLLTGICSLAILALDWSKERETATEGLTEV